MVSVTNMRHSFYLVHTIATGVKFVIGIISQSKQAINTSKQHIISAVKAKSTKYSLNSQNKINYA